MINRLVKMTFQPAAVEDFLRLFAARKEEIRQFRGCTHLELWQDEKNPFVFFTYSQWNSADDLELYRQSALFKAIWMNTKKGFAAKPEAWSLSKMELIP